MTDLVQWTPDAPTVTYLPDLQSRAVARLGEWAQSADAAYTVAQRLVQSSFVPTAFRGKPIEACAAILAGSEVGLSPMAALRSFDVIQGQAAPRAITLRAIVQSYGHSMVLVESTSTRCRMKGKRRGETEWQTVTWTIDRAKDLGLTSKDGWKKQPTAMLLARATSELARLVAADAILGIGYTAEELADDGTLDGAETPAEAQPSQRTGTRRMSRPRPAQTDDGAAEPATPSTPEADGPAPSSPSPEQRRMMFGLFGKAAGFDSDPTSEEGRAARLAYISNVIGRDVESSNDLTTDDVSRVIDALQADSTSEPIEDALWPDEEDAS